MYSVSIIVPVYNVEKYLNECLESLIGQDACEIILVDDGSTDESGRICDWYAENNKTIRVIHKDNGGLGSARNVGMDAASGKYLVFIDSDDYLREGSIKRLFEKAEKDNLDILCYGAESFSDDNSRIKTKYIRTKTLFDVVKTGVESIMEGLSKNEYYVSACLKLFRRNFIEKSGIRFNESYIHEDVDVSFLLTLTAKRVSVISDALYFRRYRQGSIMNSKTFHNSFCGYYYAIESIKNNSLDLDDEKKELSCKYCDVLAYSVFVQYSTLDKKEQKRNREEIVAFMNKMRDGRKDLLNRVVFISFNIDLSCFFCKCVYKFKRIQSKRL